MGLNVTHGFACRMTSGSGDGLMLTHELLEAGYSDRMITRMVRSGHLVASGMARTSQALAGRTSGSERATT